MKYASLSLSLFLSSLCIPTSSFGNETIVKKDSKEEAILKAQHEYAKSLKMTHSASKLLKDIGLPAFKSESKLTKVKFMEGKRLWKLEQLYLRPFTKIKVADKEAALKLLETISYSNIGPEFRPKGLGIMEIDEAKLEFAKITENSLLSQVLLNQRYSRIKSEKDYKEFKALYEHKDFKTLAPYDQFRILFRLSVTSTTLKKDNDFYRQKVLEVAPAVMADESCFAAKYNEVYIESLSGYLFSNKYLIRLHQKEIAKLLEEKTLKPSVVALFKGQMGISEAWIARGNKTANKVGEDQWVVFRKKIDEARVFLTKSYELKKSRLSAYEMITICMADKKEDGIVWLERAFECYADDTEAFADYLYSVTPKWGGSFEAMFIPMLRAAGSERYDTRIPANFFEGVAMLKMHLKIKSKDLRKSPFSKQAVETCKGYVKNAKDNKALNCALYDLAIAYWLNGNPVESNEAFQLTTYLSERTFLWTSKFGIPWVRHIKAEVFFHDCGDMWIDYTARKNKEGYTKEVCQLAKKLLEKKGGDIKKYPSEAYHSLSLAMRKMDKILLEERKAGQENKKKKE